MTFLWPLSLLLLAAVPVLIGVYAWSLRRRRPVGVRYSSLALVRSALSPWSRVRRHLPFALIVVAVATLAFAAARPAAVVSVPTNQITIILTIDVSGSMCSTDIQPSRLLAAEAAAEQFVDRQPGASIGIVAFSGFAELVQPPTTDQQSVIDAIHSLTTGRRTAIGSGILASIDAISAIDPAVAPSQADPTAPSTVQPVPQGDYVPEIVVLLTDGASNAGPDPIAAAREAADRGIRIYTIGYGTAQGGQFDPQCAAQFIGNEPGAGGFGGGGFGGGGFGGGAPGGGFRRGIDEATLQGVASQTGATYYSAESADQLQAVFSSLPTNLITRHDVVELSVALLAAGTAVAAVAYLLARAWRPLP
jgi:Ca-activated chloride channel family protein